VSAIGVITCTGFAKTNVLSPLGERKWTERERLAKCRSESQFGREGRGGKNVSLRLNRKPCYFGQIQEVVKW